MHKSPRYLSVRFVSLAAMVLVLSAAAARVSASTRQVSVESLIYDLKSPDPVRRQTAVKELGSVKYRAAIPQLIPLARDPVAAVRRELELTLETMDDAQTLPGFLALSTDVETDIRSRALASLVNLHVSRAFGLTAALLNLRERMIFRSDRDLDIIVEPDVAVDPAVIDALRARIADSDRGIRSIAIRGLGILRAQPAIPDLLQVVREDRDDGLRFDGVRALRKIADPSVAGELVGLLNINADDVRNELIATIGSMRFGGARAEFTRIVESAARTDEARIRALGALADLGDPASTPLFDQLKDDRNERLRLYANEGLARTVDAAMKTQMSAARLVEKSARVRTAQAFALLKLGESEYLDELVRCLERRQTRELAREYLLEIPGADRHALFAPRTATPATRIELADVMGMMGDPEALPTLREMAQDADKDVARAAARAARRITMAAGSQ
ncbi:MAG TPA: HEAT repeat domain-containing protein [Vicinamibacterales bacterium]|nr:HEAT repeat domain-containing protein [Vicinamibacterales bacterium]